MKPSNRQMHGANSPGCTLVVRRKMSVYACIDGSFLTKPWWAYFFAQNDVLRARVGSTHDRYHVKTN